MTNPQQADGYTAAEHADKTSHTPGPWRVGTLRTSKRGQSITWTAVQSSDGHYITDKIRTTSLAHDETQANAHLIAASPDLLEALQIAKTWIERHEQSPDFGPIATIEAAIKKASAHD